MSTERNKELARAAIEIWSTGDVDRADEIFAPDYVMHQHHGPDDSSPLGVEAIKEFVREFRRAFSDFTDTIHIQLAEGDLVSTAFTSTGTSDGPLHNVQPTGKRVTWTGMVIDRVRDGRIVESWGNWDQLGMLQQLDAVTVRD